MRSDEEIVQRLREVASNGRDWMGVEQGDLVMRLPFEAAKPFLKETATAESWGKAKPRDETGIKAEMLDYMPFAWDKANNRRGLSADRSISHMNAWLWLMGWDAAAKQMEDDDLYNCYGKPQLRAICEAFGWDWKQWDDGKWTSMEADYGDDPPDKVFELMTPMPMV